MIKGLDVSSYQHPEGADIDWHKVKESGVDYVIVKATEGVTYTNPYFSKDITGAREAGLKIGAYHFFRADDDAVAQANHFLEVTHGVRFDLGLWIDFETNDGQSPRLTHERLDQLRTVVRQAGRRTGTYTYPDFWTHYGDRNCKFCASDPLWYASTGLKSAPDAPAPWSRITIWQYAGDSVRVPGIQSKCDGDEWVAGEERYDEYTGKRPRKPQGPPAWYHRLLEYPPSKLRNPGERTHGYQYGNDVRHVQRKLGIRPDGYFGPVTEAHVKGFQKAHDLIVDGIVGPHTAERLGP